MLRLADCWLPLHFKNLMQTVETFLYSSLAEARTTKRPSTIANYTTTCRVVLRLMHDYANSPLSCITHDWLLCLRERLKSTGVCTNTMSAYMRNLRAMVRDGISDPTVFQGITTNPRRTRKRSLTPVQIRQVMAYPPATPQQRRAKDIFLMMLLLNGTAAVDIVYMPKAAFKHDRLEFTRHKSGIAVSVPLSATVFPFIDEYRSDDPRSPFLFNFIDPVGCTVQEIYRKYRSMMRSVNRAIHQIGGALGFTFPLTCYCARHTFASLALMAGNRAEDIKTCMGHTSIRTTEIYLRDLDTTVPSRVNQSVLDILSLGNRHSARAVRKPMTARQPLRIQRSNVSVHVCQNSPVKYKTVQWQVTVNIPCPSPDSA